MSLPGQSHLVGLIGAGITASLTPPLHERAAQRLGLRYLYRPVDLDALPGWSAPAPPEQGLQLLRAARELGYSACNVTHPCKQLVLPVLDEVSPEAARVGAVNTVLFRHGRMIGRNTDATGFAAALDEGLPGEDRSRVVQLGAGGAGAATLHALLETGTRRVDLYDADPARAARTSARARAQFPEADVAAVSGPEALAGALSRAVGLVNATPVGMHQHPGIPVDPALLHARLWVADVVYLPQETPLVCAARALGCRVLTGGAMTVGQAADAFTLITGCAPDRAAMARDFAELITAQQGPLPDPVPR